jgi:hypothetical protein
MGYIIVLPQGVLNSKERAEAITRELYCITTPRNVQQPYQADGTVFGVVIHPDGIQAALQVDTAYTIPVHPLATLERLVSLFPELTDTERINLQSYIFNSAAFPFGAIVPSTTTVRTFEEMEALGWFPDSEL